MRVGGTYRIKYFSVRVPQGYEEEVFVRSARHDRFFVLVNGDFKTMLFSRIGRVSEVEVAVAPTTRSMCRRFA